MGRVRLQGPGKGRACAVCGECSPPRTGHDADRLPVPGKDVRHPLRASTRAHRRRRLHRMVDFAACRRPARLRLRNTGRFLNIRFRAFHSELRSNMSQASNAVYYVQVRGKALGPLRLDQVKQLIERGQLTRSHPVSKGGNGWVSAGNLAELFPPEPEPEPEPEPKRAAEEPIPSRTEVPKPNAEAKWYYEINAQEYGPVPESQIRSLLQSGVLTADNHVWCAGMESWTPLHATTLARYLPAEKSASKPETAVPPADTFRGADLPGQSAPHLDEQFDLPPETKSVLKQCSTWSLVTAIGASALFGFALIFSIFALIANEEPTDRFASVFGVIGNGAMLVAVISLFRAVGGITSIQTVATWRQLNEVFRHWMVFWRVCGVVTILWGILLILALLLIAVGVAAGL
ncbi:MAG: DUF4339 domain-containing protein [Planctomycetota bacterium]|nr:MAG: DUF4339 domain-containing protein [Planctomycetota bacterium]